MNYPTIVIVIVLHIILLFGGIPFTTSQRTKIPGINKPPPTINLPGQGILIGKEILLARPQKVTAFLGVPYAQPPLGQNRFAPPVTPPIPWTEERNFTQFAPSCLQDTEKIKLHENLYRKHLDPDWKDPGVSEDCLYLNLFVPDGNPPREGWPVMVWFHSGDFNTGTPAIWDPTIFVNNEKILVVTVAYRLNIFGFFTTGDAEAPGNYGMLDQLAALDWIQNYIEQFNGSPQNVAIAGHSSGAISVSLHIISPLSKGKFSKAIMMSGEDIRSIRTAQMEEPLVDKIADTFICYHRPRSALMDCLRRVPAKELLSRTSEIETWGPIVDFTTNNSSEPFIPMHPDDLLNQNNINSVPILTGYTNNEWSLAYLESLSNPEDDGKLSREEFENKISEEILAIFPIDDNSTTCEYKSQMVIDSVLFYYKPYPMINNEENNRDRYLNLQTDKNYASGITYLASKLSRYEKNIFVYRFDYRPRTIAVARDIPEWGGVPHMFDLLFFWGVPHTFGSKILWSTSDKNLADVMMYMIGTFIKTGNPSLINVKWEPYTDDSQGILIINRTINMSDSDAIDYKALYFWNEYYPMLVNEAMNICCNITQSTATSLKLNFNFSIMLILVNIVTITPFIYVN